MAEPARDKSGAADARAVALALLEQVLGRRRPLDEALERSRDFAALQPRDRGFARLLIAATLRHLGQLDAMIEGCLDKPLGPRLAEVRQILRLGAAQLLVLGTPPHAAVDRSVALASGPRLSGYRALVNAVLRRLSREGAERWQALDAARLNTPDWLWESWAAAYGEAETRAIAGQHAVDPPLDLTAKSDPQLWAERLGATRLGPSTLRLAPGAGAIEALAGYESGAWWVQDLAAALPAALLAPRPGERVHDLCAAPGGKTAQLAAAGAEVTAVELSPNRARRLAENLERLGLAAEIVVADALQWRPQAPAQAVLLDAPCSATGTLRRHPDVALLRRPEEIAPLTVLQERLLAAALDGLAPGGRLVYAVCSLQPEEGPGLIETAKAAGLPFARDPIGRDELAAHPPGLAQGLDRDGALRCLPQHLAEDGGLDGFYIARLIRNAA